MEKNKDFLLKSISFHWKNYVVVDYKYESSEGCYWKNVIFKNEKIEYSEIVKSNVDKTFGDLKKELFKFILNK